MTLTIGADRSATTTGASMPGSTADAKQGGERQAAAAPPPLPAAQVPLVAGPGLSALPLPEHLAARALSISSGTGTAAAASTAAAPHDATIATPNPPAGISAEVAKERGEVLDALGTDFQSAMAQARQDPAHSGPGWVTVYTPARGGAEAAGSGASAPSGTQAAMPNASKPGAPGSGNTTRVFSETAFRDAYLAAGGSALQAVARHYGAASVAQVLEQHPEIRWTAISVVNLNTADPALRPALNGEGPPPSWTPPYSTQALMAADPVTRAYMERVNAEARRPWAAQVSAAPAGTYPTASVDELRAIDASLAADGNRLLLAIFADKAPGAAELDPTKVATYGLQRAQAMAQLVRAQAAAGVTQAAPIFKGEPPVSPEWLAKRAELVEQVQAQFNAFQPSMIGHPEWLNMATHFDGFVKSSTALNALAQYLGFADSAAWLATGHPDLAQMRIAVWRGGPAPAGTAMASAEALGAVDLALNDPENQALIQQFGGPPPTPNNGLAQEQVRLYGLSRYQAMTQLAAATAAVRQDYLIQLNNARTDAANPAVAPSLPFLKDSKFNLQAFTAWYEAQPGAANQAFLKLMGPMTTRQVPGEESGQTVELPEFAQSPFELGLSTPHAGEAQYHVFQIKNAPGRPPSPSPDLLSVNPQAPPELNEFQYLAFDANLGWFTPRQNIHHHESAIGEALHTVVTVGIAMGFGAVAGGEVAGWLSGSTGLIAGAAAGAAASTAVSGAMNNNFSWHDVLKAGLIGGATAGLSMELASLGEQLGQFSVMVTNPAFNQALTQGTIAAIQGESFGKAALAGFASGLSQSVGKALNAGIDDSTTMSALEKAAAHTAVRALTSAISIAGDPSHPSQAFAAAFVKDFVNSVVSGIDFEKEIWGKGTPEQLSEARMAERMKEFQTLTDANGKPVFSTPAELAALRRLLLQMPDLTPAKYQVAQINLVHADNAYPSSVVTGEARTPPPGFERVSAEEAKLPGGVALDDPKTGFHAEIFRNEETGMVTVAFRGTDQWRLDSTNGNTQAVDATAAQYQQASALAYALKDIYKDKLEGFTGHSLGGGLAATCAALTGTTAITFDAAGVNQSTIDANLRQGSAPVDVSTLSGRITNYRLQGDLLTGLQENGSVGTLPLAVLAAGIHGYVPYVLTAAGIAAPNALGEQVTLMPINADGTEVGFFTRIFDALYLHSREALLPSMRH